MVQEERARMFTPSFLACRAVSTCKGLVWIIGSGNPLFFAWCSPWKTRIKKFERHCILFFVWSPLQNSYQAWLNSSVDKGNPWSLCLKTKETAGNCNFANNVFTLFSLSMSALLQQVVYIIQIKHFTASVMAYPVMLYKLAYIICSGVRKMSHATQPIHPLWPTYILNMNTYSPREQKNATACN